MGIAGGPPTCLRFWSRALQGTAPFLQQSRTESSFNSARAAWNSSVVTRRRAHSRNRGIGAVAIDDSDKDGDP